MDLYNILNTKSKGNRSKYQRLLKLAFIDNLFECINKSRYKDNLLINNDLLNRNCRCNEIDNTITITFKDITNNRYNVSRILNEIFHYSQYIKYSILDVSNIKDTILVNVDCNYLNYSYTIPIKVNCTCKGYPKGRIVVYKSIINDNKYCVNTYTNMEVLSQIFLDVFTSNIPIKKYYDLYNLYNNYKINNKILRNSIYNTFLNNNKLLNVDALYLMINSMSRNTSLIDRWKDYKLKYNIDVEFNEFCNVLKEISNILR